MGRSAEGVRRTQGAILIALAMITVGCGAAQTTITRTVASNEAASTTPSTGAKAGHHAPGGLNNPAQHPEPHTTVSCGEAKVGHACISATVAPSNPNKFRQRNCDPNIVANSAASCSFAENTFYEYYESAQDATSGQPIRVHSPTTGENYSVFCSLREGLVACTGVPLSTGIYVSFPNAAVVAYTPAQAAAYAASRDVGNPESTRAAAPPKEESQPESEAEKEPEAESGGEETEGPGSATHAEDEVFCSAHECIPNFSNGHGTVVECADGEWSHSGGVSGACSDHGGEKE